MSVDILLTGSQGQLGWEVKRRAKALKLTVHAVGHDELDIADRAGVLRIVEAVAPKVIVNAAAYTAVDKAENDAATAFAVNRDGPGNLAQASATHDIPLIHVSTDYVFDGSKTSAYVETDAVGPLGVYGASKLAGEEAVRQHAQRHVILRTAWVYGVQGHNFVKTMLRLGGERDVLTVVDDQRGCPTFAADLADAVLILARRMIDGAMPPDGYGTFHCTGAGEVTWCGFARKIFEIAGPVLGKIPTVKAIATADYPTPAKRPANSVLDGRKLSQVHGITLRAWEPALADMLKETLAA